MTAHLLLMAKAPIADTVKTRLVPPLTPEQAAAFYAAMLADTVALLQQIGHCQMHAAVAPANFDRSLVPASWDVFPQEAGDLGTRLEAAFHHVLAQGAPGVVAFGVDSPTLPPGYVSCAIAALARADVILGPTEDGGCYAIGLRTLPAQFFTGIAWSTDVVCRQLSERSEQWGLTPSLLPAWYDLDTEEDVERHWTSLTHAPRAPHTRAWLLRAFPRHSTVRSPV